MQSPLRLEVSREEGGSSSGKERFLKATQTELELNRKVQIKEREFSQRTEGKCKLSAIM